jgi:Antibiotic biosynthesis monooxygenase
LADAGRSVHAGHPQGARQPLVDWSRSVDDPNEFVLVEAFRDGSAGSQHVKSDHFQAAMKAMPVALVETPKIINFEIEGDDWSRMGELEVPPSG